jgi:Flp pilus assembly protein TadG
MCLKSRSGSVLFEFAVAGIPILLLIISVIEISRGMWTYSTLEFAVTEASRLVSVHAVDCGVHNNCTVTVSNIAAQISGASQNLDSDLMNVTLSSALSAGGSATTVVTCTLTSCGLNGNQFPTSPASTAGSDVIVTATYPFQSPLTMFFPGLTNPTAPITITLSATSREPILF